MPAIARLVALANLLDDAHVERASDIRQIAAIPDLPGVEEMCDSLFEARSHRDNQSCCSGLYELGEERIDVLEKRTLQPVRFATPEVRVVEKHHLLPLEGLLEEADVLPFGGGLGQIRL